MTRKTPYKHKVTSHVRNGVSIPSYERGSGKPRSVTAPTGSIGTSGAKYNVSFFFSDGTRETYNVDGGTYTAALRQAIPRIQQAKIPYRAQIRRFTR